MNYSNKQECEECEATGKISIKNVEQPSTDTTGKKIVGIYGLQNKLDPNKWYVGQSVDILSRWAKYKSLRCKSQRKWFAALSKYGYDGFTPVILETCNVSKLDEREIYWIGQMDSVINGYNIKLGGNRKEHSNETIALIRKKRANQVIGPRTEKQKEDMRRWNTEYWATHSHPLKGKKGRKRPDVSERNRTRNYTEEEKLAMTSKFREYQKLHGNPMRGKKRPDLAERNRARAKSNHPKCQ